MGKLDVYEKQMRASPDQQISLTDPDSRSMATSGRGSGVVGYNVQVAVDTEYHLIVTHEVTNSGSDRAQLAIMAKQAKTETLDAVADRGYSSSPASRATAFLHDQDPLRTWVPRGRLDVGSVLIAIIPKRTKRLYRRLPRRKSGFIRRARLRLKRVVAAVSSRRQACRDIGTRPASCRG